MKLKSGEELIKYITEQTVGYLDTPKADRKEHRTHTKEPWSYRWFGMLPLVIHMWKEKRRHKK